MNAIPWFWPVEVIQKNIKKIYMCFDVLDNYYYVVKNTYFRTFNYESFQVCAFLFGKIRAPPSNQLILIWLVIVE